MTGGASSVAGAPAGVGAGTGTKIDQALATLARCKGRTYVGWFRGEEARGGTLRGLMGLAKKMEEHWTDQQIVPADVFVDIEWACVVRLFGAYQATFLDSAEHAAYLAHVAHERAVRDEGMMGDFLKLRKARFLTLARDVKRSEGEKRKEHERVEREATALALRTVDGLLGEEVGRLYDTHVWAEVRERVFQVRCAEQEVVEGSGLMCDEAVEWAVECALDQTYQFYTKSLIETLWQRPECQKGMEEYAGFRKPEIKDLKKKVPGGKGMVGVGSPVIGDYKKAAADAEWLELFMRGATATEHSALSQDSPEGRAAGVIQRRARGVQGRTAARKAFATTFVKRYDPASQRSFYANSSYNVTSWARPALMARLFPRSTW